MSKNVRIVPMKYVCHLLKDAYSALGGWVKKFGLLTDAYLGGGGGGGLAKSFAYVIYHRFMEPPPLTQALFCAPGQL